MIAYFAALAFAVKLLSAFRIVSPVSFTQWASWTIFFAHPTVASRRSATRLRVGARGDDVWRYVLRNRPAKAVWTIRGLGEQRAAAQGPGRS